MITHNLFPTPVSYFKLDSDLTADELSFINGLEVRNNDGNTTSADNYLFKQPQLARIRDFCEASLLQYFTEIYAPKEAVAPYITQSWANYTSKGQWHHKHEHPNSIVSGVFYVQAKEGTDKIHFFRNGYQQVKVPTENFNLYNSESWWLGAATGELLLFPSNLTHMVQTVESDETRISISFNTFLQGYIGSEESLTAVHL
jgi:uncharacterized protein (TIGR02466 family)